MPTISPSPTPSLSQLTETTNARTPEPEPFVPLPRELAAATMAAPAVEVDVDVLAECRQPMSEVHSEEKRGDVNGHDAPGQADEGGLPVETLYLPDLPDRPCSALSERQEIKLVEEEIAAVLSGESEVLKEHNVLGCVLFNLNPFLPPVPSLTTSPFDGMLCGRVLLTTSI